MKLALLNTRSGRRLNERKGTNPPPDGNMPVLVLAGVLLVALAAVSVGLPAVAEWMVDSKMWSILGMVAGAVCVVFLISFLVEALAGFDPVQSAEDCP